MTVNEYQSCAVRTARVDYDADKLLNNGAMGLCGEAGEVADIVKKHLFQDHPLDKEKLKEELGDVAWYLAVTAYSQGIKLEDVLQGNVDKLLKRYPDGFDAEKSINRPEYQTLMRSDLDAFGRENPQFKAMLSRARLKECGNVTHIVYEGEYAVWAKLVESRIYSITDFVKRTRGADVSIVVEVCDGV